MDERFCCEWCGVTTSVPSDFKGRFFRWIADGRAHLAKVHFQRMLHRVEARKREWKRSLPQPPALTWDQIEQRSKEFWQENRVRESCSLNEVS